MVKPEDQAEGADHQTAQQQVMAADSAQEGDGTEVGELQVRFAAGLLPLRHERRGESDQREKAGKKAQNRTDSCAHDGSGVRPAVRH